MTKLKHFPQWWNPRRNQCLTIEMLHIYECHTCITSQPDKMTWEKLNETLSTQSSDYQPVHETAYYAFQDATLGKFDPTAKIFRLAQWSWICTCKPERSSVQLAISNNDNVSCHGVILLEKIQTWTSLNENYRLKFNEFVSDSFRTSAHRLATANLIIVLNRHMLRQTFLAIKVSGIIFH